MKKKIIIFFSILLLLIIGAIVWWNLPVHFLKNTNDISTIKIFNGTNGNSFEISEKEHIDYIVEHIQNSKFEIKKVSLFYMGTYYNLTFIDDNGKIIDKFIINANDTIRKDPFFYQTDESMDVIEYIEGLEPISEE